MCVSVCVCVCVCVCVSLLPQEQVISVKCEMVINVMSESN